MKSAILAQLRAELAQQEAAVKAAAAAKAAATATATEATEARAAVITAAQRQARAAALAAKAARREQLLARRSKAVKVQPHGWTVELAAAAAAARVAEEVANWTALAKAKAKAKAKAARAAGVLSLTALEMAKAKKAKAERNKEADVYSAAHVAKQERKALLASIAEYRNARKWAAKKGRNAVLLARLVLKEAMPVAAAKAVVAKLATKRQAKAGR